MCILNTDGCNVLETLPEGGYMRCLDLLRDIILGKYVIMTPSMSIHWISLSTQDMGLEQIRAISDFGL